MRSRYLAAFLKISLLALIANSQQEQNQLVPVINDLSAVARLINGISVQSDFMRSSKNLDAVVGELLGVGDSVPELLKLNVKNLMKDVDELLKAVKGSTTTSNQSLEAIGDAMKFLKSIDLEKLKKAGNVDMTTLNADWDQASSAKPTNLLSEKFTSIVTSFKLVMSTESHSQLEMEDSLDYFLMNGNDIKYAMKIFQKENSTLQNLWKVIGTKSKLQDFSYISEVSKKYLEKDKVIMALGETFTDMNTAISGMKSIIDTSQKSSIDKKIFQAMTSLLSTDKKTNQTLTVGLPNGIGDMKLIFDDLKGEWLKENIGVGKDVTMLITALEPLRKFYENMKPLETSWSTLRKDPATGQHLGSIAKVLLNGRLLKPGDMISNSAQSAKCAEKFSTVSSTVKFDEFDKFYNKLDGFDENLKLLRSTIEKVSNSPALDKILEFNWKKIGVLMKLDDQDSIPVKIKKISDDPKIREISTLIFEYHDALSKINMTEIGGMIDFWQEVKLIHEIPTDIGLIDALDCLNKMNFDFGTIEALSLMDQEVQALKNAADAQQSMKKFGDAIESLINADKNVKETVNGMKVSRRRRRRALGPEAKRLLKLADSQKVARNLGNGVEVLRELNEVFVNQEKVLKIASVEASVDAVIQSVPEINRKWTVENKKALKTLVDDVNKLNKDVGKNRSLESRWMLFAHAQSVNGAPIEGRILGNAVFKVLDKHSDTSVKKAAVDFKDFPPLQFDFTGSKKTDLRDAFMILQTVTRFFKDFFAIDTSSTQSSDASFDWLPLVTGAGGIALVAALGAAGYYGWKAYMDQVKLKNKERYLIYIGPVELYQLILAISENYFEVAERMINKGAYVNYFEGGNSLLHIAVENRAAKIVECLIRNGADRNALSDKMQTPEELLSTMKNDVSELQAIFKKYKGKRFQQKIPDLKPWNTFTVLPLVPSHKVAAFCRKFGSQIFINKKIGEPSHLIVDVDANGVYHYDSSKPMIDFYSVVFGPAIVVSTEWANLCVKSTKNMHKDYACRVTKAEFNGKIYDVDRFKEFARGRHIKYGHGINMSFLMKPDSPNDNIELRIAAMGFDVVMNKPVEKPTSNSFHKPDLKTNLLVYDGKSLDEFPNAFKDGELEDFKVMSLDEFTVFLLEFQPRQLHP